MASVTYQAVGNREDLIDVITNIAPDDAPLMNKFGRADCKSMTHAWLTDSIGTPGANKHLEDADYNVAAATTRVRLSNYVQIFMKGYFVTESQEQVLKAGLKSEIGYQMAKCMKEIARDVEYAVLNNAVATEGDAATAGQFGGIPCFNSVNTVDCTASSGDGKLTETRFNDAVQLAWTKGGVPEQAIVSGKNKRLISGWTAGSTKNKDMANKRLVQVIEVYESDFGVVKMMAHRMQPDTRVDILEMQYWKLAYLIPFKTTELPKDSLKIAKVITGQLTMECRTKEAHSAIINITG